MGYLVMGKILCHLLQLAVSFQLKLYLKWTILKKGKERIQYFKIFKKFSNMN